MTDPSHARLMAHWPIGLLAVAVVWAYVDLRTDLDAVQAIVVPVSAVPAPGALPAPGVDVSAADAEAQARAEAPVVPRAQWRCEGTIAQDMVQHALGQQARSVFACHQQRMAEVPGLGGLLLVELLVGAEGAVATVHVSGSIDDEALRRCVAEDAVRWQFPPPVGGDCAIVSAPFRLDAPDAGTP